MRIQLAVAGALLGLFAATAAVATEHVVTQKNNEFNLKQLRVKKGDSISFRNDDPHFHNVFSLSDAKSFDLGSFPKGESRKVTFDKEGTVEVECAIHPSMKLKVDVAK